jgi:predicted HAD superfamily Cof-like phosphohydrolase
MKTALRVVRDDMQLPRYALSALAAYVHPQERTWAFHKFYGAPIRLEKPDIQFSHMDNERVAFRASFILSEVFELLEKGLGVRVSGLQLQSTETDWVSTITDCNDSIEDSVLLEMIRSVMEQSGKRDLVEVVDALGDLNVVVNGFALELGVNMDKVDQEICASNFTKAGLDGKPIIGDGTNGPIGKVLKGPNYTPPQLGTVLGLGRLDNALDAPFAGIVAEHEANDA